jgi:hypothetical protein
LWGKTILHKTKKTYVPGFSPKYFTIWTETWTLNTQQANILLETEMAFWRRSARKSRKEKVRNGTNREVMEVRKNILEVNEEKVFYCMG